MGPVGHLRAIEIWLSEVGAPGGGVTVESPQLLFSISEPVESQQIYIWARPDPGETLTAINLSLFPTDLQVIRFTGAEILNPVLGQVEFPPPPRDLVRFAYVPQPIVSQFDGAVRGIGGAIFFNRDRVGAGLGPATTDLDPLYDREADAWLLASATYDVLGPGTTHLFLQIGPRGGIGQAGQRTNDAEVVFGGGSDPPLNGNDDRERNSATPDATIRLPAGIARWVGGNRMVHQSRRDGRDAQPRRSANVQPSRRDFSTFYRPKPSTQALGHDRVPLRGKDFHASRVVNDHPSTTYPPRVAPAGWRLCPLV